MSQDKTKQQLLDEFWDISSLIPKKRPMSAISKSTDTVEISHGLMVANNAQNRLSEDTVIRRFIPPYAPENQKLKREPTLSYVPEHALLHKVTLYKERSEYDFYADFCKAAADFWNVPASECEYEDFFSYSPQYDQLTLNQRKYYFWWRDNVRRGIYLKTNLSYINLYTYELINSATEENAEYCRDMMLRILESYPKVLVGNIPKYIRWISDLSLIHRLTPPQKNSKDILKSAGVMKEYFVHIPGNTAEGWARALLLYCCSYDYRTSKFAKGDDLALFESHTVGALAAVVGALSGEGKLMSGIHFDDCKVCAPAFEGALCASKNRYVIEVEYCSFSRSHEMRFLIGDAVKYTENKLRAYLSVKSRLTVYSLPNEVKEVIDAYFVSALPSPRRTVHKKEARQEYDALYDLPGTKLDISRADEIEKASWDVTRELVEPFEQENTEVQSEVLPMPSVPDVPERPQGNGFAPYLPMLRALQKGNAQPLAILAREQGRALDAIVDEINEIAVELLGDILLIEDNGSYAVIEDYADIID